jgi:hypothetical protein
MMASTFLPARRAAPGLRISSRASRSASKSTLAIHRHDRAGLGDVMGMTAHVSSTWPSVVQGEERKHHEILVPTFRMSIEPAHYDRYPLQPRRVEGDAGTGDLER